MDLTAARQKMEEAMGLLIDDLATLKIGRASPSLVEKIMVEAYDTRMPLVELATINTIDGNQLSITPFDQSVLKTINQALALDRGLGLNPVVDGNLIRLKIPPLSEERRKELVKVLGQKLEAARIMIRQIRSQFLRQLRQEAETEKMSEDELFRQEKKLQEVTDEFREKIQKIGKEREKQLLEI